MSNIALSFEKDGSDGLTHNVQRGRKGTQNGIVRVLGYQVLFFGSSSRGSFYYCSCKYFAVGQRIFGEVNLRSAESEDGKLSFERCTFL